nr:T9SS type A sorting domain-containing protein [Chitinophagales bacterium]
NYHCSTSIKTSAFTIFNIFGEVVYTQNNVLPNEIIQNNLPSGIYLCQLTLNYKQILTGKLIVI